MRGERSPGNIQDLVGWVIRSMNSEGDNPGEGQGEGSFDFKVNLLSRIAQPYTQKDKNAEWLKKWDATLQEKRGPNESPAVYRLERRLKQLGLLMELLYDNGVITDRALPWDSSVEWEEQ